MTAYKIGLHLPVLCTHRSNHDCVLFIPNFKSTYTSYGFLLLRSADRSGVGISGTLVPIGTGRYASKLWGPAR